MNGKVLDLVMTGVIFVNIAWRDIVLKKRTKASLELNFPGCLSCDLTCFILQPLVQHMVPIMHCVRQMSFAMLWIGCYTALSLSNVITVCSFDQMFIFSFYSEITSKIQMFLICILYNNSMNVDYVPISK